MLAALFQEQCDHINAFFKQIDMQRAQEVLDACLACTGKIVFSGIGKSGIVAEKLATTLTSTGTHALNLPPTNALHGDIGILNPSDLLIMLSKSGESDELLNLLPLVKLRKVKTIAWVSNPASRLAQSCDLSIHLPLEKELCPFDLAPMTSSALQLIFGDILSAALMKSKAFSLDEYAQNHPAGAIGKKVTLKVRDLMLTGDQLPLCAPNTPMCEALLELSRKRCGCILIVRDGTLLGIFTDGDLRRALQKQPESVLQSSIEAFMHPSPDCIHPDRLAIDALRQMEGKKRVMMLPVVEENALIGLVHLHDILQVGLS